MKKLAIYSAGAFYLLELDFFCIHQPSSRQLGHDFAQIFWINQ